MIVKQFYPAKCPKFFIPCFICGYGITDRDEHTKLIGFRESILFCKWCRLPRGTLFLYTEERKAQLEFLRK